MREATADKTTTTKMARRAILLLAATLAALVVATGAALAATVGCQAGTDCLGTRQADTLTGTASNDLMHGRGGADTLRALEGDDDLFGQGGTDRLLGGPGRDELSGGPGDDTLKGGDLYDHYFFGPAWGKDTLVDSADPNQLLVFSTSLGTIGTPVEEDLLIRLTAGAGPEVSDAGGTNTLDWEGNVVPNAFGGNGDDEIRGNSQRNVLRGEGGRDAIYGYAGSDIINTVDGSGGDEVDCGESLVGPDQDSVYYDVGDQVLGNCEIKHPDLGL